MPRKHSTRAKMFAIILDPHGTEQTRYRLADNDLLDCGLYAERYAQECGYNLSESTGIVPDCSGDFRVELREDPENTVCIWSGQSYYFEVE